MVTIIREAALGFNKESLTKMEQVLKMGKAAKDMSDALAFDCQAFDIATAVWNDVQARPGVLEEAYIHDRGILFSFLSLCSALMKRISSVATSARTAGVRNLSHAMERAISLGFQKRAAHAVRSYVAKHPGLQPVKRVV